MSRAAAVPPAMDLPCQELHNDAHHRDAETEEAAT
jgi:hypothetical protein